MKRKLYKVKVKVEYITTMTHEQTSMGKAKTEVEMVVRNYLKDKKFLDKLFDLPPMIKVKVEKL